MRNLIIGLFCMLSVACSGPTPSTKIAQYAAQSLVRLTDEAGSCSGEVIAPDYVLSAGHCVKDGLTLYVDGQPSEVVMLDEYYDLLLLHVKTSKPVIRLRWDPIPQLGEPMAAIGYGLGWTQYLVLHGWVALQNGPLRGDPVQGRMAPGLIIQMNYVGGMSGGMVIDAWGNLVGVIQGTTEGLGYGVTAITIRTFLLGMPK